MSEGTPIDPSDIRIGDRVLASHHHEDRQTVESHAGEVTDIHDGSIQVGHEGDSLMGTLFAREYWDWSLLHRPDPDPSDHPTAEQPKKSWLPPRNGGYAAIREKGLDSQRHTPPKGPAAVTIAAPTPVATASVEVVDPHAECKAELRWQAGETLRHAEKARKHKKRAKKAEQRNAECDGLVFESCARHGGFAVEDENGSPCPWCRVEALEAARRRVLSLHCMGANFCVGCIEASNEIDTETLAYPCPTVRALGGA